MLFKSENIMPSLTVEHEHETNTHQAIVNVCYNTWKENNDWSYSDMVDYVGLHFGKVVQYLLLIGKYNQQVCNGGHMQYIDNGYATDGETIMYHYDNLIFDLHIKMMNISKEIGLHNHNDLCSKVYKIQDEFLKLAKHAVDLDDSGHFIFDKLDDQYYKIDDDWMKFLEEYAKKWVNDNKNPLLED